MSSSNARPASVTNLYINSIAMLVSLSTLWWLVGYGALVPPLQAVFLLAVSYALPVIALEAIWLRPVHRSGGRSALKSFNPARVGTKLFGLAATGLLVTALYWLLPEYRGSFYNRYYSALLTLLPWGIAIAVPYFAWVDRRTGGEKDGYWHLGQLVLLNWRVVDRAVVGQHLLGWLVKLFFLPLMFTYFVDKVDFYRSYDFSQVFSSFKTFYDFSFQGLFYIDLLIAFVGYMCTFKATDSHIRSTEPTLLGWFVALLCYQPFWSFVSAQYIDYQTQQSWGDWFWDYPPLYVSWGCLILFLTAIYAWSSLSFGIRFSNLTHRGILTNGAYKYCKHPAYVSKNLSWWLISMPFMIGASVEESVRHCLLLLVLNIVYLLRARTEERHLSSDRVYCEYARYIEEHGVFRSVGRRIPMLQFAPGQLFKISK